MRRRYLGMALTIASGASIACSDAAVEQVTAPVISAKPAAPVAAMYPYAWQYYEYSIPSALGIQVSVNPRFEDDYGTFVATARFAFQWVNDVSGSLTARLINKNGTTVNSSTAGMHWYRFAMPVPSGDTTLTVRVSTNNIRCGLVGKTEYSGHAAQIALDAKMVQIKLYQQTVGPTSGPDVAQPECPPPPGCESSPAARVLSGTSGILASDVTSDECEGDAPLPPGGGDEEYEICYTVWRELWIWDWLSSRYVFHSEWIVGVYCYFVTAMT